MFWVHEDVVKPSMTTEYETVCKELTAALKQHSIPFENILAQTDDNRYLWVGPIASMQDTQEFDTFEQLAAKMGEEEMGALFERMDKCYEIEHNYIIHLSSELSYMPEGMTQTPEGQNYRKFYYLHTQPGTGGAVAEQMKAIKAVFASKNSPVHYRVYRSGFGTRGEFFMVAVASASELDEATESAANRELLGEEGQQALGKLFGMLRAYEEYSGWMRPDITNPSGM